MFLVKNSTALRSQHLLNGAKELIRAQFSAMTLVNQRQRHTDADKDAGQGPTRKCQSKKKAEDEKKCVKFVSANALKAECVPVEKIVPKYYKQLNPCKTDKELAVQHPKYLGVYGRCDIPYLPEPHCQDPCDLVERLDDKHYKPSKSLDRDFDQYWVECIFRKQKRCCKKVPPERTQRVIYNKCAAVPKGSSASWSIPCPASRRPRRGLVPNSRSATVRPQLPRLTARSLPGGSAAAGARASIPASPSASTRSSTWAGPSSAAAWRCRPRAWSTDGACSTSAFPASDQRVGTPANRKGMITEQKFGFDGHSETDALAPL
ncbi:hypothetical protein M5D96_008484 [Drosophila gunungcola]|uniref:Uncharacterized protein n=1 Tax=Drosophila gunungcola TaxID=103775 RepID=A0A9P9YKG1_9MUSC|nr:hypothetical protein M5D96_008484 [Drosophila gunungcola]